jgi:hypothetical protein
MLMVGYYDWAKRNVKKMNVLEMEKTLKEAEELQKLMKINLRIKGAI